MFFKRLRGSFRNFLVFYYQHLLKMMGKILPCHYHRHARDQTLIEATVNIEELSCLLRLPLRLALANHVFHTPRSDCFQ